jgi:UDP-N-acetylmuramate dehydrogenase
MPIEKLASVAATAGATPAAVPHFPAGAGLIKIPAAWLLEQAGFHKGYRLGRAGISSRHTLALINVDCASAADILALHDEIVAGIRSQFAIDLEMEPVLIG